MSDNTGWSLQILFQNYKFSGSISEDGSILTAWEPLDIHPCVRANRTLMALDRF